MDDDFYIEQAEANVNLEGLVVSEEVKQMVKDGVDIEDIIKYIMGV